MDLVRIKKILDEESLITGIYFVSKKKDHYATYSPDMSETISDELVALIKNYLEMFSSFEQVEFNPTGYRDGTTEICDHAYVGNYDEVIGSLEDGIVEGIDREIDNFTFYCFYIRDINGNEVRFFRRVTKFKRLSSKGLIAAFNGNQLNRMDSKLIGLDGEIDLIDFEEEILILNHVSLERIFRINDQYYEKAQQVINSLRKTNRITNMDAFEEDCLNNIRHQKTLTKMLSEDNELEKCFDNFDNVLVTIDMFDLEIETQVVPQPVILYENKSQITDILRLARDSYYKSLIREQPGIDNKI